MIGPSLAQRRNRRKLSAMLIAMKALAGMVLNCSDVRSWWQSGLAPQNPAFWMPRAPWPPLHRLRCPRIGGASLQYRRQRLFTIGSGSIILNDRVWRTIHECKVISPAKRNGASRCRFRYNCSCARLAQRWWFRLRISSPLSVELWHQRKLGETWPIPPRQCGGRSIWKIHLYAGCSGE
jgi:hypothetical protein